MDNLRDLAQIPSVPDKDCYEPSRPLSAYEVDRSYYFPVWNREQIKRPIANEQIHGLFHIVKGRVVGTDTVPANLLYVKFPGLNEQVRYGTDYKMDGYQSVWKKLTSRP